MPHRIQHVPVGINSLAIIISEISKVKDENTKKQHKKANNSYIVSPIVTKIAQQIDLVKLNNVRFNRILISAFVFELLNVKVKKIKKKVKKGQ